MATLGALRALFDFVEGVDIPALDNVLSGHGSASDYTTLGEEALSAIASAIPVALPYLALAELLVALAPIMAANFHGGDPDPIHDAQTTDTPHSGRRG